MGLDYSGLRFLATSARMGMSLASVCTLGRQNVFATHAQLLALAEEVGVGRGDLWERFDWRSPTYFAEEILRLLGAETVDSVDFSDFEGASLIHDLNAPVPEELRNRFDAVVDGGTLEHIFNYPVGLANAMRMTKPGGQLFLITPSNNQCGHGFYQFSPELYFRALTPENGFELVRLYMVSEGRFYHVVDPQIVHGRVELLSGDASVLYVHARKLEDVEPFRRPPQQSDYQAIWTEAEAELDNAVGDGKLKGFLRERLGPERVKSLSRHLNRLRQKRRVHTWRSRSRLSNRSWYVPVERWDVSTATVTGRPETPPTRFESTGG